MALAKSINLLAIVSFALFYVSLAPIAANALSVERAHVARSLNHAHAGIAKKKRDSPSKRCKPRPSSSTPPPSSTPAYTPTPAYSPSPTDTPTSTSYTSTDTPSSTPSPSPSSTTTSSSSPSPTPASSSPGKVGLAWSNNEETSLCNFVSGNTHYVYDWKSGGYGSIVNPSSCGLQYIPMCWGPGDFPNCINDIKSLPVGPVFSLNEPDQGGQANCDVATAVSLWFEYIQPLGNQGYQIISPACTNSPTGFGWIQSFVSQVQQQGGWMNGVATHLYSTDLSYSISFLQSFISAFPNYPIWVTEYACEDYSGANQQLDYNGVVAYMTSLSNWMFENPSIEVSFAFAFFSQQELVANNVNEYNSAIGDNNEPSALGSTLLNPS